MEYIAPFGAATTDEAYTDFDPNTPSLPGSIPPAAVFNAVQAEMLEVIEHFGLTPDGEDQTQLRQAIQAGIAASVVAALTQGGRTFFLSADWLKPRETNNCAAVNVVETSVNKVNYRTLDFDKDAQEYAQCLVPLPKSWNAGTIECRAKWDHGAATVYGVVWSFQGVSIANDESMDSAFGTAIDVEDTGGTEADYYLTPWSDPITVAGAGDDELIYLQVSRKVGDAADTLDTDARLIGVEIRVNINAGNDE